MANHLFGDPVAVTPSEFRRDLWQRNTRVPWLSYGVVCVIYTFRRYSRIPACNERTDRRTDRHGMTAYTALA